MATAAPLTAFAAPHDDEDAVPTIELGEEYRDFKKTKRAPVPQADEGITFRKVALYLPNRILDIIDILKFDIGVGPSFGGVVRITKYAQAGARAVSPISVRAGLRGRKVPVFIESSSEIGISPAFRQSYDREVGAGELGAGLDFIIFGVYAGIDVVGIADFFGGLFGFDPSEDDVK